ncbi:MAG: hypothetical protein AAFQ63_08795 [Cyanobacteria bacterium J06621_11]
MVDAVDKGSKLPFNEVAIADFNQFQIAVLTKAQSINRYIFSVPVSVPERLYQTQGWLIFNQQVVAQINNLKIGLVFSKSSPFKSVRRLAPSIPIFFEVRSCQPLPAQLQSRSAFSCQLPNSDFPYHTVFRCLSPRFVRLYPFNAGSSLVENVKCMLAERDSFITQNYEQLKQVPFYQKNFGL